MTITVHQALFGDREDGYGLLKATCNTDLARRIANSTDMYEQTPDGVNWGQALRGFAYDDHYLLMRTLVDPSPTVRRGRVYSHCLIIPIAQVKNIDDLRQLLTYLPINVKKDMILTPIKYNTGEFLVESASARTNFLISKLVNDNAKMFAWIDYPGYEDAVCTVWNNISSEIRPEFRFGIAFSENESMNRQGIKILSVPSRLITKWIGNGTVIIAPEDASQPANEAERLVGGEKESNSLYDFICRSGIVIKKIEDYSSLQKVLKTTEDLPGSDLNSLLTLFNTLAVYQSKGESGQELKNEVAQQVNERLKRGTVNEIIRVRNENFESLISPSLSVQITQTVNEKVIALAGETNSDIADLIANLLKPTVRSWWRTTVNKALINFFSKWQEIFTPLVLQLVDTDSDAKIALIDELVPLSVQENGFIAALMEDPNKFRSYPTLIKWSLKRKWLSLHAFCLTKMEKIREALLKQENVDPAHKHIDAFELIAKSYSFQNLFEATKSIGKSFFTSLTVNLCLRNDANLKKVDLNDRYWQEILLLLINQQWDLWSQPVQAKKFLYTLLDSLGDASAFTEDLLLKFSMNGHAGLYDYPKRATTWKILPSASRNNFLNHTAVYFLENETMSGYAGLEIELKQALQNRAVLDTFIDKNRNAMSKVLPVFGVLIAQENYVKDYINYYGSPITVTESILLGRLIKQNNWKACAKEVYHKSSYSPSFRNALSECDELLGVFDRIALNISGTKKSTVSEEEWWNAFCEMAIELFPEGPKQKKIWEEAGGKLHDLDLSGNGRQQWGYAINLIKNGSAAIKRKMLLKAMHAEYGNNQHLHLLQQWLKNE